MGAEEIPSEAIEALRAILDARLGPEVADQARLDFGLFGFQWGAMVVSSDQSGLPA